MKFTLSQNHLLPVSKIIRMMQQDHTSASSPSYSEDFETSGDMYAGVPHRVVNLRRLLPLMNNVDRPKSASFKLPKPSNSKFSGFKSR